MRRSQGKAGGKCAGGAKAKKTVSAKTEGEGKGSRKKVSFRPSVIREWSFESNFCENDRAISRSFCVRVRGIYSCAAKTFGDLVRSSVGQTFHIGL